MDYKRYNDNELIYMIHENDEESNNILFEKYKPIILKLSRKYYDKFLGCGYDFEDFYQEALAAFYRAVYKYNDSEEVLFYSFVVVCIKRALATLARKIYNDKNGMLIINSVDIDDISYLIEDIRENPNTKESYSELERIIKEVIFSVPLESSSILELKLNGFTYKEISILLDIPISSVEFKSRKSRNILRNKIRAYYCR